MIIHLDENNAAFVQRLSKAEIATRLFEAMIKKSDLTAGTILKSSDLYSLVFELTKKIYALDDNTQEQE
jgi:hypothetical protein